MAQKIEITILSTFANDKLVDVSGSIVKEQSGGPALYLEQVFKNEKIPFILKIGPKMEVQILITNEGEFGKVQNKLKPKKINFSQIKTPFLLISSILDEFDLNNLSTFDGKIFFDIQGYVRDGNNFGKKKIWKPNEEVIATIFGLKGTKEELENISTNFIEAQKKKLLLVTNGKYGCEFFVFGKRYLIKPENTILSENTIGAGDTFFAYFISRFIKTDEVFNSVEYAIKKTSDFLSAQKKTA